MGEGRPVQRSDRIGRGRTRGRENLCSIDLNAMDRLLGAGKAQQAQRSAASAPCSAAGASGSMLLLPLSFVDASRRNEPLEEPAHSLLPCCDLGPGGVGGVPGWLAPPALRLA